MFIARKSEDFSRRVQLQRTKNSPAGLILPLNQKEKSGYDLDYPQGQKYATLGGKLSRNGDQSRLFNDLTLIELHTPSVDQLNNRNSYSSRIEDKGTYFPANLRSSPMKSLEMDKTNLTTLKRNETHLNRDFNKDLDQIDLLETRKIFRSNSSPAHLDQNNQFKKIGRLLRNIEKDSKK